MNDLEYFGQTSFDRVNNAIKHLQNGKGIMLVDDENRENEGDLIFAAEYVTVENLALMIRACSGIICLCLTSGKAEALKLMPMVARNTSRYQTPFTASIEAVEGVTTGVSASDRLTTIRTAIHPDANPQDLARPGHVFPLIAQDNGVFTRRGHTEGSVDLVKLAGLNPAAVLCELTNENGTMARLPEIMDFAITHQLMVVSIEDIVQYRLHTQDLPLNVYDADYVI
ncbi:3,4-dihydroxy 2-butanone 4-phosphate synthase [Pedobacter westerhofensis]|uniref:3,4-dihydroxy-2-butanone 4-phosphate synthase n=1 Tax=Pedobacter westerhofensis TaxID=425512 RepID=A0A521FSU8_9SPHI|nr:3,4-dihydroxy-2-butanone-4-phosphate synthase [Pedobacter westerhofensis]SMO98600.1 3,4-dihydroxy 2-butanone 4-phosphate synthase [Pedobacter westerhofensis]